MHRCALLKYPFVRRACVDGTVVESLMIGDETSRNWTYVKNSPGSPVDPSITFGTRFKLCPVVDSSTRLPLSSATAVSRIHCVALCLRIELCRAVIFDKHRLTCELYENVSSCWTTDSELWMKLPVLDPPVDKRCTNQNQTQLKISFDDISTGNGNNVTTIPTSTRCPVRAIGGVDVITGTIGKGIAIGRESGGYIELGTFAKSCLGNPNICGSFAIAMHINVDADGCPASFGAIFSCRPRGNVLVICDGFRVITAVHDKLTSKTWQVTQIQAIGGQGWTWLVVIWNRSSQRFEMQLGQGASNANSDVRNYTDKSERIDRECFVGVPANSGLSIDSAKFEIDALFIWNSVITLTEVENEIRNLTNISV
ncbi:uncharacterized protein LOC141913005 [Tubulanus polymorphus]|uniref:uncharacterized protein LOC141913005 n=1 Tax=Tubulanus polymorphus TaxID=672921 RepID=UPI003DA1E1CB